MAADTPVPTEKLPVQELSKYFSYDPRSGIVSRIGPRVRNPFGHTSTGGYIQHDACGKKFYAHRVAWAMTHGVWPVNVDHINGNRKDNRIENLRAATRKENNRNLLARNSVAGLKGILPRNGKYICRILVDYKRYYLGTFQCPIDAALAYDRAAAYFFGEFAATNFGLGLIPSDRIKEQ